MLKYQKIQYISNLNIKMHNLIYYNNRKNDNFKY